MTKRMLALAGAWAVATAALAQANLPDPTRPPAGFAVEGEGAAAAVGGPVLESVILPKKGHPMALISGRQVRVGENYGESRLIRLTEREAVLQGPAGIERLSLTPGVEKTDIVTKSKATTSARTRNGSKP